MLYMQIVLFFIKNSQQYKRSLLLHSNYRGHLAHSHVLNTRLAAFSTNGAPRVVTRPSKYEIIQYLSIKLCVPFLRGIILSTFCIKTQFGFICWGLKQWFPTTGPVQKHCFLIINKKNSYLILFFKKKGVSLN